MFALVLLALVAQAFAGEYIDARCPVVRPVDNFDYASFSNGIWYEVGRYDNRKEKGTECSYSIFTPMGDRFKIENIGLRPSFSSENGQNTDNILNIMSTDNANYAVLYHCNYNEETKTKQVLCQFNISNKIMRTKQTIHRATKIIELARFQIVSRGARLDDGSD
nr:bilin-binding protein-like [Danaus plexippus plexippus]